MRMILLCLVAAACGKPNPEACCTTADDCLKYGFNGITPCADDLVCNANGTCVTPQCHATADCNDPTLICDIYGECVPSGNGSGSGSASQYTLTVEIVGSGAGAVTSTPAGITCSSGICSGTFDAGSQVQLTQMASSGSFLGWTSACKGTDTCTVTLSSDQKVGAMFGTKGEPLWSRALDGSSLEWGHGVVANSDGDTIAVGQYIGTIALDTVTIQSDSPDVTSAYVVKLDGLTGKAIWGKNFPVQSADMVASDGEAVYVLGRFSGTVQLGTTTLTSLGSFDLYAMKLGATGDVQWAMSVGGPGAETPKGIAVANGTVAFVGFEPNGITIGSTITPDFSGSTAGFVVALDTTGGAIKWSRAFAANGAAALTFSTFAGTSLLVSGEVVGTVDFGAGNSAPIGTGDAFVAHYDFNTGSLDNLERWGASGSSAGINALSQDSVGHLVVVGGFSGSLTLGTQTYTATGSAGFVANFNASTNVWFSQWSTTPSGASMIFAPSSISVGTNDIAIAGVFCNGTLRADVTTLTGAFCTVQNPARTGFLVRMKNNGTTYISVHSLGPIGWTDTLVRTGDDRLFVTGKLPSTLALDTGPVLVQAPDGQAAYVMAFAP